MVTVGVLVRAAQEQLGAVTERLAALEGVVETLPLEQPGTLGLVLAGADLDVVHRLLTERVARAEGVLAAWPVHTEFPDLADPPVPTTHP